MIKIQEYLIENLDDIVTIMGIIFGTLVVSLFLISETVYLLTLGLALIIASITYLLIKNKSGKNLSYITKSEKIILECIFFSLFLATLVILHNNVDRPFLYFLLISISIGVLSISIVFVNSRANILMQIIKIFLISFNLKYSIFLNYFGAGVDYWEHLVANNNLAQYGYIEILPGKESSYPLMHIYTAINQLLTNTPIKEATNFAIIIPLVIASICIFLVTKRFLDVKTGLLAMLIFNISDYIIYWGSAPQTTTFGICLFCFLVFLILKIKDINKYYIWISLLCVIMCALIMTHAVSSFITLITISGLLLGSYIHREFFENDQVIVVSIFIFLIYFILIIQYWFIAIYNNLKENTFFETITLTLKEYVVEHADFLNRPETISNYAATLPPLVERIANTAGISILLCFTAIGSFFLLSNKNRNQIIFSIIISTVILLFVTFVFPLFGIRNIMPTRWFAFIYFFLSILAACAILKTSSNIFEGEHRKIILFMIMIFLSFFMVTSTISNLDSPLWLQESSISTSYTIQEGIGAESLVQYSDSIFSDTRYGFSLLNTYYGLQEPSLYSMDLSKRSGSIFIWRNYMKIRPIRMYNTIDGYYGRMELSVILGPYYLNKLNNFNKIYENDDMSAYIIF